MPTTENVNPPWQADFDRLERLCEQLRNDLDVQFKRIAQLQADIDMIRGAWTKVKPRPD